MTREEAISAGKRVSITLGAIIAVCATIVTVVSSAAVLRSNQESIQRTLDRQLTQQERMADILQAVREDLRGVTERTSGIDERIRNIERRTP